MQNTERLFIFILILVGLLFLYILSIFFAPGDHLSRHQVEPIYIQDGIDDSEDEDLESMEEPRSPQFERINIGGSLNPIDSDRLSSISNPRSFKDSDRTFLMTRLSRISSPCSLVSSKSFIFLKAPTDSRYFSMQLFSDSLIESKLKRVL